MSHYTKEDIIRIVEEEDVEFIRLQFVDIFGILKNMAVTAKQLDSILNNRCTFDAAAINGFDTMHVDELVLVPDLDTFTIFPWRPQRGRVARFICDVRHTDGTPFMGDSRYILKQVIEEAAKDGYTLNVGPESEFFLFDMSEDGQPTTNTSEKGGFFDIGPVDAGENARRDIVLSLSEMGFEMESSYHSNEVCQHHIDFKFDDGIQTADNIMTFKLTVRTVAKRHGLHATFMPKPNYGKKGSAMFFNMFLSKDGENIFSDPDEEYGLSKTAYYFMGGIKVNLDSKTSMEHLYAVGETSCNGVHGKNRLASNSLLESLVFARRAADDIIFGRKPDPCRPGSIDLKPYEDRDAVLTVYHEMVLNEIERMKKSHE